MTSTLRYVVLFLAVATCNSVANASEFLEEIVVTAKFRDADVLKTPGSISVIDADTIIRREARHLEEVLNLAPNVNYSSGASRGRYIQIRGIGERSQFIEPLNPSVGILIDNIDYSGIGGAASTLDIKQIEILRGPQGTLYGANALAGLINLKSNDPSEQLEGSLKAVVGDYGYQTLMGVLSGPINDAVGYRLAIQHHEVDGFVDNDFLDKEDTDNIDELTIRGKLRFHVTDALSMGLSGLYVDIDNGYDAFSLDNTRHTLSDEPGHDRHESKAVAIEAVWQRDGFDAEVVASYADNDMQYGFDEDWSFVDICTGTPCEGWEYSSFDDYTRDRDSASIDLRLVSHEGGQFLNGSTDWVVGIYWRDQDESLVRNYTFFPTDFTSTFETRNLAVYGQLDTRLSDSLTLSTGLRLEHRKADYTDSDTVDHDVSETLWGGLIALEYSLSEGTMVYGLISRGYKAGGVNSNPALDIDAREFDTEDMWNFESGIKGVWLEGNLQAQLALFYQKREEIQVKQSLVDPIAGSSCPCTFTDYFANAAKGSNYGLELEFYWHAHEVVGIYGSLGLLETEFDDFLSFSHANADSDSGIPVDLNGREQAHAPSYQFALGVEFQISESLTLNLETEGKDRFYLSPRHEEKTQDYEVVHASLRYLIGSWELSAWGRNLTDEDVIVRGFGSFGNDPRKFYATEPYYQYGERRVVGVSVSYDF
ncbi:MAG: TonB-dependent receptor [Gammaproteobacteria bacterium]|nr:TonB-dependent receptor [Gammaproteobacteria bacterium]